MTMLAPLFDAGLRGALVALLLLVGVRLLRDHRQAPAAGAGACLLAGLVVQVISSLPAIEAATPRLWLAPLIGISIGNSVLFWVFARALFDDGFVLRRQDALAWLVVVALGVTFYIVVVMPQQRTLAPWPLAVAIAMRWVPMLFAALALVAAMSQWRNDLVERRRRLRVFIVAAGAAYTVITAAARLASDDGRLSEAMASVDVAMLLLIAGVVAGAVLRVTGVDELFALSPLATRDAGAPSPSAASTDLAPPGADALTALTADPADDRLAAALRRMMTEERAYRSEDLTITRLAERLGAAEYRLRRIINQRLGHRNFNAYVNAFRLDDAKRWLIDPEHRDMSILTIALDAGFGSIGPFNRAFKADTGLTPTEFRRRPPVADERST